MAVLGEPSKCRLDVLLARPPGEPQYVVVVALGHKPVFRSSLLRRGLSLAAASIKAKPSADRNLDDTLGCWLVEGWHSSSPPNEAMSGRLLLVVLHFLEVGVDDIVAGRPVLPLCIPGFRARAGIAAARLLRPVEGLAQLHGGLRERRRFGLDGLGVLALHSFPQLADGRLDAGLVAGRHLLAQLLQRLLGRVDQGVGAVSGLYQLALLLVLALEALSLLGHARDLGLRETARRLDADRLFLACRLVSGLDVHDSVGVDVEPHLDLWHAARRRWDTH